MPQQVGQGEVSGPDHIQYEEGNYLVSGDDEEEDFVDEGIIDVYPDGENENEDYEDENGEDEDFEFGDGENGEEDNWDDELEENKKRE